MRVLSFALKYKTVTFQIGTSCSRPTTDYHYFSKNYFDQIADLHIMPLLFRFILTLENTYLKGILVFSRFGRCNYFHVASEMPDTNADTS